MIFDLAEQFNRVPVEINRVSGTQILWRANSLSDTGNLTDQEFTYRYSWVIRDGFFFEPSRILADRETAFAERYGGSGIGCNGGGARVINFHGIQLKGVGANSLAGRDAPHSHSYGGLDIQGAVKEIVYSRLLNKISPVGAQQIHGLLLLDRSSAAHNGNKAPSVLMVREQAVRPAHFLPCLDFRVKPEYQNSLRSDFSRILGIYKNIAKSSLLTDFYVLIQDFLDKCADQMSFFRMARLSHNALIPSNLCFDGRVLDTGLCSFVVSGTNYGQLTSFFEEAAIPPLIARELFHLIKKFTLNEVIEDHFLSLYGEKFNQYAIINAGFVFGINREMSIKFSRSIEWLKISSRLQSLLSLGSIEKTSILPTVDSIDFANDIIAASLFAVLHKKEICVPSKYLSEFSNDLASLMKSTHVAFEGYHGSEDIFSVAFAIQTLKRIFLSSYFFITYIGRSVDVAASGDDFEKTVEIIHDNDKIMHWFFEDLASEKCTLFSSQNLAIEFDCLKNQFRVACKDSQPERFKSAIELLSYISHARDSFIIQDYDFQPFLIKLCSLLIGNAQASFRGVQNVFS